MNTLELITSSVTANVIIDAPFEHGWFFISMFFLLLLGLVIFTSSYKSKIIKKLEDEIKRLKLKK